MNFVNLLFYSFSLFTVFAAVMVISSRNPVHSVLWLIFAFFNSAGLFILLGAEMLAMLLVIVYVGAVAVLFLFVVMMLNVRLSPRKAFQAHLPLGLLLAAILFVELSLVITSSGKIDITQKEEVGTQNIAEDVIDEEGTGAEQDKLDNVQQIGRVLYTDYILYFQTSGLILLVAMIGAIVLTLRHREGVRRQKISEQNRRSKADTLRIVSVETGKGIE